MAVKKKQIRAEDLVNETLMRAGVRPSQIFWEGGHVTFLAKTTSGTVRHEFEVDRRLTPTSTRLNDLLAQIMLAACSGSGAHHEA